MGVVKGYKDETCPQQGTKNRKMFTLSCTYKFSIISTVHRDLKNPVNLKVHLIFV